MIALQEETSVLSAFWLNLEKFQGPFDVLLQLIDDKQIEICEVSLTQITAAYLNYLRQLERINFILASEFLIVAAYLVEMKSKSLLPVSAADQKEEMESVEDSLVAHLQEYKMFKQAALDLKDRRELFQKIYARYQFVEPLKVPQQVTLTDVSLKDLVAAFQKIWQAVEKRVEGTQIEGEIISVEDKIKEIISEIRLHPGGVNFRRFFKRLAKLEVIVTFLAVLELIKQKTIRIQQESIYGEIVIFYAEVKI